MEPSATKSYNTIYILVTIIALQLVFLVFLLFRQPKVTPPAQIPSQQPQPTQDLSKVWINYANIYTHLSFDYPGVLKDYVSIREDGITLAKPAPSDMPLFDIDVYESSLTPQQWWQQHGDDEYSWLLKGKITPRELVDKTNQPNGIKGIDVTGQRLTSDNTLTPAKLFITQHRAYIYVINDNTEGFADTNWVDISRSLRFTDTATPSATK